MLQMDLDMYVPILILDHMRLRSLVHTRMLQSPVESCTHANDEMPNLVANLQGILVGLGISGSGSL
jgi:hypothetical protein